MSTHYSTQIEGNGLTAVQVKETIQKRSHFPGKERDENEVKNYYKAIVEIERFAINGEQIHEKNIKCIHGIVLRGNSTPTPYRDGQNVIRDSISGNIVYLPPEANDVPVLMAQLIDWINQEIIKSELPSPIIAAIAHYQYATIHPYYDGNGRTARLLTNLILHKTGYGLKGIYSLEEYYAQNLNAYYDALSIGTSHNYYFGRIDTEITSFVEYFCHGMSLAFSAVRRQAINAAQRGVHDFSPLLRKIDPRQRRLLELFRQQGIVTSEEIAFHLGLSPRTIVALCKEWVASGFLELHNTSRKSRSYRLASDYENYITRQ
jgi:Fic family protein